LAAQQRVEYDISFPNAAQHEARVVATFRGVPRGSVLHARMSRSSPGRYALHEFAKNVYDVSAEDSRGRAIALSRPDPYGWDAAGHDGTVRISYTVFGDRTDGTYLGVDRTHAHLNMPATFMWARGMDAAPIRLAIHRPSEWQVATQLVPTSDSTFTAPNLQWFMDSPTEVGPVTWRSWSDSSGGKRSTWRMAIHHLGTEAQVDSFAAMTRRVVAEEVAIWGEPAGYDHGTYTFIVDYLPWASGDGMEHRNSTIVSGRGSLVDSAARIARLGTIAHEFFHSWNVERLRPKGLEPFDFERANMSGELWFAEGFTSYFGPLAIRRAGLYTDEQFLRDVGGSAIQVIDAPGRQHFSAVEMSMQAPFVDAATSVDPVNRANTFISYYTWGEALGLALDLSLRERFDRSLDEFMRTMWRDFGRRQTAALAPARPYTVRDLRVALGSFTRDTAFANDFFRRYVEGREVADYARLLAPAGFLLAADTVVRPSLGASLDDDTTGVFVNWSSSSGSAYAAGIGSGDIIYSVGGEATTTAAALRAAVARHRVGETVQVDVRQRGLRHTIPMTLRGQPSLSIVTCESAGRPVTDEIRKFREAWLGSKVKR
ncbi:MAG TPA: PDZ domain-containing protein, partial [Gemmatimonadaceae bacterium]|nr:PDZ domain-containing protein [Gemmatimonadaceae bacterium]